jgi:hypothetical protein
MYEVMAAFSAVDESMLEANGGKLAAIGKMAESLMSVMKVIADAPLKALGATSKNWNAFGSAVSKVSHAVAVIGRVLSNLKTSSSGTFGASLRQIRQLQALIQSIVALAALMPDSKTLLRRFDTSAFVAVWDSVGKSIRSMVESVASSLNRVPDMRKLEKAQRAIATLRDIFGGLSATEELPAGNMQGTASAVSVPQRAVAVPEGAGSGAVDKSVKIEIHIGAVYGTDRDTARRLADNVSKEIMQGVRRHLVGQNG